MSHHQICWSQIVSRHASRLRVDRLLDQSQAWQGSRIGKIHERRGVDDVLDVDIDRLGDPLRIGTHDDHLARPQNQRIAESSISRQTQAALEDQHLDIAIRHVFHHDRRAGNRRRHRGGMNGRTAQSLRHLEEHGAFLQRHVARAGLETEKRFRADPGQRIILEQQLGPGFLSGLQTEVILDDVANLRGLLAGRRVDDGDAIDDLGDLRRGQRAGACELDATEGNKGNDAQRRDASQHMTVVLTINTGFMRSQSIKLE
ncbi:MAG TPA: hypothetical protein VGW57_04610 [Chthoniobacterales bacterium]|nr:hypothetical protein [Chthoniobacterales bacterium]